MAFSCKSTGWGLRLLFILALAALSGCGGAGTSELSGPGVRASGSGVISGACSASSTAAKFINENPRIESPGLAFDSNLAALGVNGNLIDLDGSCALKNSTLKVISDTEFPNTITNQNSGFIYNPNDPRFQQINSYHYANKAKNTAKAANADLSRLSNVSIDAHCNARDNAFFSPSANKICFGFSLFNGKKVYASDDSDVIMHEFGHGINHALSSTNIMFSSYEAGAIDEAVADYWALTTNNNANLAEWYYSVLIALFPGFVKARNATSNNSYPSDAVAELHDDSRVFSQALWAIRQQLGGIKTDKLVVRMMNTLPATTRFQDAVSKLRAATSTIGLSNADAADALTKVDTILSGKGLKRTDSAAGLSLSNKAGHKQVYIIDDHTEDYSFLENGNCNGALDVGETAMLMVNVQSAAGASQIGMGVATLTKNASVGDLAVDPTGDVAEYFRLNGNGQDFTQVLEEAAVFSDNATVSASFLVEGLAPGQVNLTLSFTPTGGSAVTIPVSITVGSVATRATDCVGGGKENRNIWPVP